MHFMDRQYYRMGCLVIFGVVCLWVFGGGWAFGESEESGQMVTADLTEGGQEEAKEHIAAIISCKDMIDDGLYQSIQRRSRLALAKGASYLIYEIQTYGGLVKSADDISKYLILDVGKKAHTVAYVTTEAISAGAMVSVACKDIIMLENTTIGDCAPISLGGQLEGVEREKAESFIRAAFSRAAEANGYPEALLKAMVSQQLEVWRVKNNQTGENEYFEKEYLPRDPNKYDIENKLLLVKEGELLAWTSLKAKKYGIAREVVEGLDGVLEFLSERDGVVFSEEIFVPEMLWSEKMVRWINSPGVMAVLVMLAMLGVYVELNSPGVGLPGLMAVICIVIIIGSKYLVGMANWMEVAIFFLGVILLAVEVFVIPGFGVTGLAGILCIMAGLFGMLVKNPPEEIPWPDGEYAWDIFTDGLMGLSLGFVGFLVFAFLFAKYLPKLHFLSGLMLSEAPRGEQLPVSMTVGPGGSAGEGGLCVGDVGEVVSPLRPAGQGRFGGNVVDVVTEGDFVENGSRVQIAEIHGNRVVVREVDE
jgi:membrane-bound serine protease (ClpP class)